MPPGSSSRRSPVLTRSWMTPSRCSSRISVPTGTLNVVSLPLAPVRILPLPAFPFPAITCRRNLKSTSVFRLGSASTNTLPPRPPLPPSGPPNSTNFSRRKLTAPAPPVPERACILARSTNCIGFRLVRAQFGQGAVAERRTGFRPVRGISRELGYSATSCTGSTK